MDSMRKAFEAHCARNWIDTDRVMDGPYKDASTQRAWEAWQAATMVERERCANVCEAHIPKRVTGDMEAALSDVAPLLADAIRSRTE